MNAWQSLTNRVQIFSSDDATVEIVNAANYLANSIFTDKQLTDEGFSGMSEENICTLFVRLCQAFIDLARLYDEDYGYPEEFNDEE